MTMNKRQHDRQTYTGEITFNIIGCENKREILPSVEMSGAILDLSEMGIGLSTVAPLEPGQVLRFVQVPAGCAVPPTGMVVWTAESGKGVRVGVQFLT